MSLAFQRNDRRRCSRCNLPLEDPASEERGYGPVCAKKDTQLYARTIVAQFPYALAIVLGMDATALPEACQPRFQEIKGALVKHAAAASNAAPESDGMALTGEDLRKVIKSLDWILSFKMEARERTYLVSVVKWLGYTSLAAVLSLEASTSAAPLWFKDGFLHLKGASCRAGFLAMKEIPGIRFPARRGNGEPFVAHAAQANLFLEAVQNFWPFYTVSDSNQQPVAGGTIDSIRQEAEQWLLTHPVAESPVAPSSTTGEAPGQLQVELSVALGWAKFRLPWVKGNNRIYDVINAIKQIPSRDRRYDPVTKEWSVRAHHLNEVRSILGTLYKVREVTNG